MKTRCKFKCMHVEELGSESAPHFQSKFEAVINGSDENAEFFRWTPSGSLNLGVHRENVFEVGKEYFLDISEAE